MLIMTGLFRFDFSSIIPGRDSLQCLISQHQVYLRIATQTNIVTFTMNRESLNPGL